jgi:hypothetical protein
MIKHKLKAHEKDWNTSFLGKVLFVRRIGILIIWWMMEERVAMRSLLTFEKVWFNWRISWILVTFDSDLSHNNSNNSYNINKDSCFKNEKGSLVDSVIKVWKGDFFFHNKWKFKCKKQIHLFSVVQNYLRICRIKLCYVFVFMQKSFLKSQNLHETIFHKGISWEPKSAGKSVGNKLYS